MNVCENSVDNVGDQPVEIPPFATTVPITAPSFDLFQVLEEYMGILFSSTN